MKLKSRESGAGRFNEYLHLINLNALIRPLDQFRLASKEIAKESIKGILSGEYFVENPL